MEAAKATWSSTTTGRCLAAELAGYFPRKFPPFQSLDGRIGLGEKPPPQFGQTLPRTEATQFAQKVHSKLQILASVELGKRRVLQCSQVGRSSSMSNLPRNLEASSLTTARFCEGYLAPPRSMKMFDAMESTC